MKEKSTLFKRDFTLVVIGQIISLFGNAILRFALPLYLLQKISINTAVQKSSPTIIFRLFTLSANTPGTCYWRDYVWNVGDLSHFGFKYRLLYFFRSYGNLYPYPT